MDGESDYFRASVGALITDGAGQVLAFQRRAGDLGRWQLPQGGLHRGEAPFDAVLREVGEETAIPAAKLQLVGEIEEWLGYELPPAYRTPKTERGQVQKWFLLRFVGGEGDIRPDMNEFVAWQWMAPAELLDSAAPFRRAVYRQVLARFSALLAGRA